MTSVLQTASVGLLFFVGQVLPYVAVAVFVIGMTLRTASWLRTPVPFPLALDPTRSGLATQTAAMATELLLLRGLFRGDRRLWLWAALMHGSLAVIVVGHVVGIPLAGQEFVGLGTSPATSIALSEFLGVSFGLLFVVSMVALLARRRTVPEVRRLSAPADYFDLTLLLAIAATGLLMRLALPEADQAAIRGYLGGLLTLRPVAIPSQWLFLGHFALVNALLLYFPFSKLVHLTGGVVSRALLVPSARAHPRRRHIEAGASFSH